jgi:hypothetical protein
MNVRIPGARIIAAVLSSTMFLTATGCSSGPTASDAPSSKAAAPYSGVDTFKGIFFREGPAAEAVAPLGTAKAQEIPQSTEQQIAQLEHAIAQMKADGWSEALISKAQAALDTLRAGGQLQEASVDEVTVARDLLVARIAETDPTFFDRFGGDMQSGDHLRVEAAMAEASAHLRAALSTLGDAHSSYQPANKCIVIVIFILWFWVIPPIVRGDTSGRLSHAETIDLLTRSLAQ